MPWRMLDGFLPISKIPSMLVLYNSRPYIPVSDTFLFYFLFSPRISQYYAYRARFCLGGGAQACCCSILHCWFPRRPFAPWAMGGGGGMAQPLFGGAPPPTQLLFGCVFCTNFLLRVLRLAREQQQPAMAITMRPPTTAATGIIMSLLSRKKRAILSLRLAPLQVPLSQRPSPSQGVPSRK